MGINCFNRNLFGLIRLSFLNGTLFQSFFFGGENAVSPGGYNHGP